MNAFLQDLRYAVRTLRRSPASTLVIVASLAIGIGANTAIFTVVNALLLKPLPYPDPDRLAVLWLSSPGINIPQDWPSPGQYIDLQTENRSFEEMSISQGRSGTLLGFDQPERVEALRTSSSLFHLLGARPLYGRLLLPEEDTPGKPPVVILSHGFWRRVFNADPNVIGRSITMNGVVEGSGERKNQFTVAGVLGPDFLLNDEIMPTVASIRRMDVFLPLPLGADAVTRRGDENYNIMARLKPGVTMADAQADVSVIAARIRDKDKRDRTFTISVVPLLEQVVGNVRRAVLVLFGSVTLVLLIACANVANLLLTRATSRQKEVAIRTALGAAWQRLVRQLLLESVLLGVMGGAVGLLIALAGLYVVRTVNPGNIPRLDVLAIDRSVLAFTFAVSILTGVVFGLAPAVRAARADLHTGLKAGGRNTQGEGGLGSSRRRLRSLLVVAEVAFSLMLLTGAGLLIKSFVRLQSVSPGFTPDNVISMRLGASGRQFPNREAAIEFFRQVGDRIAGLPGVKARGGVSALPFTSSVGWGRSMSKAGRLNQARNCRSISARPRRTTSGRWRFRWYGAAFLRTSMRCPTRSRWPSSTRSSRSGSGRTRIRSASRSGTIPSANRPSLASSAR
jgi:predicted permease